MKSVYRMNLYRMNSPENSQNDSLLSKAKSLLSNTYVQIVIALLIIVPIGYLVYTKFIKKTPVDCQVSDYEKGDCICRTGQTNGRMKMTRRILVNPQDGGKQCPVLESTDSCDCSNGNVNTITPMPTSGTPMPTSGTPIPTSGTPTPTSGTPIPTSGTPTPTEIICKVPCGNTCCLINQNCLNNSCVDYDGGSGINNIEECCKKACSQADTLSQSLCIALCGNDPEKVGCNI